MPMNPRLLVPRATFDPDAAAYLRAVEAADGQALETPVKRAVDDFFRGMKADGTFSALKAACLLCGARTLAGALTPLAGAAPTNNNFVDADYNRETGLVGNGSTKYLDSNRANNADPQDDNHNAAYVTNVSGTGPVIASRSGGGVMHNYIDFAIGTRLASRSQESNYAITAVSNTLQAHSRSTGASFDYRCSGVAGTAAVASSVTHAFNVYVFARNTSPIVISSHTIAFYSIGESLDLALLDARVTALVTAIGAAL
jgi:hypothetical protein